MDDPKKIDPLLRKPVVAKVLGICTRGVERLIARGELEKVVVGVRAVAVPETSVIAYQERIRNRGPG